MISPAEMQLYADQLLRYWLKEQQRQASNNSARNAALGQQPAFSNSRTPASPITPGTYFTPTPSTAYPPSVMSSSSTVFQIPQYAEPMEGVQPTQSVQIQPQNPPQ